MDRVIWLFIDTWHFSCGYLMDIGIFIWLDLLPPHGTRSPWLARTCGGGIFPYYLHMVLVRGIGLHMDRGSWRANCLRRVLFDGLFYHFLLLGALCKHWRVFLWIILFIFHLDFSLKTQRMDWGGFFMDYFILSSLLTVELIIPPLWLALSSEILLHELEVFYLAIYPSATSGGVLFDLEDFLLYIWLYFLSCTLMWMFLACSLEGSHLMYHCLPCIFSIISLWRFVRDFVLDIIILFEEFEVIFLYKRDPLHFILMFRLREKSHGLVKRALHVSWEQLILGFFLMVNEFVSSNCYLDFFFILFQG